MRLSLALALVLALSRLAVADRIKDLAMIDGVRENHLSGFGLVVGLDGSGDDIMSPIVKASITKMLKRLGQTIDPTMLRARNVAAVMVTAELPPFGKPGMAIDVTVSSMGNATTLAGGTLVASALKGPDGRTWAIAQGALSVGGFTASGATGSTTTKNQTLVGIIPGGATLEAAAPTRMPDREIRLVLADPDFTTATRVAAAIEAKMPGAAHAIDASMVAVEIPPDWRARVPELIANIEALEVDPDVRAKVVIDEKTGTIVVGEAVTLRPAAVTFGSLTVEVSEAPLASQPVVPLGPGATTVVPQTQINVTEAAHPIHVLDKAATVGDVAAAFAALGAKPRDLVAILRALKAAGALRADLELL